MANKVIRSNMTEELKHYGVLGMKWGVRKSTIQINSQQEKSKDSRFIKERGTRYSKIGKVRTEENGAKEQTFLS